MQATPSQTEWNATEAAVLIRELQDLPGACLPILHALQQRFGYVDDAAVPLIAAALSLSRAEVVGVIHFYRDFRTTPGGRHTLHICRAEACQSMGCERLVEHVEQRLGLSLGATSDGALSIEEVFCLGNCALSPAVMLDGRLYGRVTPATIDRLVTRARDGHEALEAANTRSDGR